ncbi:hypothetical protein [Emticicia fluvialis]|uniref:hypothetical protein n=1 Tax=Emticicia fluvialis TaxID=2974474 RepID=UPI002164F2E7|nr:hypothetical protein [Emticicia fluvialis]
MRAKLTLIGLISIALILFYFTFFVEEEVVKTSPYGHLKIIPVKVKNDLIFIKYAYGGITDDKEIVVVSKDSSQDVDDNKDFVYRGGRNNYLYFIKNDTLHINVRLVSKKANMPVKIDTAESAGFYYNLYFKRKLVNDSIRVVEF